MTLVPDEDVLGPALVREKSPIVRAHLPGSRVESDGHDLYVFAPPGSNVSPERRGEAEAIARDLRGGRDPDPDGPIDWHVHDVRPHLGDALDPTAGGTWIWLSQSYPAPV